MVTDASRRKRRRKGRGQKPLAQDSEASWIWRTSYGLASSWRRRLKPYGRVLTQKDMPWSVRILTREPISTTKTTEMPTTMEYLDDGTMTTLNHAFLRDKWWLIVNIGTAFVVVSSVMSAFLIYKSFRLRALSNSNDVSTTMDLQTTEVSNANGVVITSEDPANRPPAMPES
uniref:Transmembrane protein n=1 Tax=Panagrellus redivivus TaxID=6233 RepID=A0A7E4VUB7_PANRE